MAKVENSPGAGGFRGKLGNLVYRKLYGELVVSRAPDFSNRVLTLKQRTENAKLRLAGAAWKESPPEVQALFKARARELNKPPFALFFKNFKEPPVIGEIDLSQYHGQVGQPIRIRASDLVQVARVEVSIRQAAGPPLESGLAAASGAEADLWIYQSTVAIVAPAGLIVEAIAFNCAGRRGDRLAVVT